MWWVTVHPTYHVNVIQFKMRERSYDIITLIIVYIYIFMYVMQLCGSNFSKPLLITT